MAKFYYTNENGNRVSVTGEQLQLLAKNGMITPFTIIENEEGKKALAGKVEGLTLTEVVQPKPQPTAESSRDAAADLLRKFFKGGNDVRKHNTPPKVAHDQQQRTTPKTESFVQSKPQSLDQSHAAIEARYQEAKRQEEEDRIKQERQQEQERNAVALKRAYAERQASYRNVSKNQNGFIDNLQKSFRESPLEMSGLALLVFMVGGIFLYGIITADWEEEYRRDRTRL